MSCSLAPRTSHFALLLSGSPYPENASPTTNGDLTIVRGCCWFYPPERCRAASRMGLPDSSTLNYIGFRVVIPEQTK